MTSNISSAHVFQILRHIAAEEHPVGVADVARTTGLPSTTVYRALMTLTETRYISRDDSTATYRLGEQSLILVNALFEQFPISTIAWPSLRQLAYETGETVCLSVKIGWYSVRVAAVNGHDDIVQKRRIGLTELLHRGAASKLILARLTDDDFKQYLEFVSINHPTFAQELAGRETRRTLERLRQQHFNVEPTMPGKAYSFGMPISDAQQRPIAVIEILSRALSLPEDIERIHRWLETRTHLEHELTQCEAPTLQPFEHVPANEIILKIHD